MKRILLLLIAATAVTGAALAELEIVSTERRDAESFKRLSEYFTGKEDPGRYAIFRTEPEARKGFYISLAAPDKSVLANVANVRLSFVRAGTQEIVSREMPTQDLKKRRILVGLTGEEWQSEDALPAAWKVELLDPTGATLESAESFLWAE